MIFDRRERSTDHQTVTIDDFYKTPLCTFALTSKRNLCRPLASLLKLPSVLFGFVQKEIRTGLLKSTVGSSRLSPIRATPPTENMSTEKQPVFSVTLCPQNPQALGSHATWPPPSIHSRAEHTGEWLKKGIFCNNSPVVYKIFYQVYFLRQGLMCPRQGLRLSR